MAEKDGENDTREEDTNIRYIDIQRTRIDWYVSIRNLAAYGKRTGYNMSHYRRCIDRWVSFFSPHLRPVTDSQSANESASYLSTLTLPESDVEIVERKIKRRMEARPGVIVRNQRDLSLERVKLATNLGNLAGTVVNLATADH
jgi:hypothetical protein